MGPARGDQPQALARRFLSFDRPGGAASATGLNDGRVGARRDPEHRRQAIERHHQHVVLTPVHSTSSNEAQDRQRAAPTPPSPTAGQPCRLLVRPGEMAPVVGPGLRLNHNADAGGGNRYRVDVAPTLPGQRMSHPPALRLERRECALDLVLRASANPAATGERKPVEGVIEAQPGGREEQQPAERRRSGAPGREPEQHSRDAA